MEKQGYCGLKKMDMAELTRLAIANKNKTMTDTKTTLTIEQAVNEFNKVTQKLIFSELRFTAIHNPALKHIRITAVKNCDSVKVVCPNFTIQSDERLQCYAELVINYE